jgi:hypothetical protein
MPWQAMKRLLETGPPNEGFQNKIPQWSSTPIFLEVTYLSRGTGAVDSLSGPEKPNIDHVLHS